MVGICRYAKAILLLIKQFRNQTRNGAPSLVLRFSKRSAHGNIKLYVCRAYQKSRKVFPPTLECRFKFKYVTCLLESAVYEATLCCRWINQNSFESAMEKKLWRVAVNEQTFRIVVEKVVTGSVPRENDANDVEFRSYTSTWTCYQVPVGFNELPKLY